MSLCSMRRIVVAIGCLASLSVQARCHCTASEEREDVSTSGDRSVQVSHPLVVGYERFYRSDSETDAEGGRFLFSELNCASCHDADGFIVQESATKQAPILSQVGQRVRADHLREYISDPQAAKAGTTMPNMLKGMPEQEKAQVVEALVHLLASTGRLTETVPQQSVVANGEELFHSIGCVACHQTRRDGETEASHSVPLPDLGAKYTIPGLTSFLMDPLSIRPSARMPHFNLSADDARYIATYLLQDIEVEPNIAFKYYEGDWQNLPDFSELEPANEGVASSIDVTSGRRLNQFGMTFSGYLRIDDGGDYTIHLGSDDGSRILINDEEISRVDGVHPFQSKSSKVRLDQGIHKVDIEYFEAGGEEILRVEIEGPGIQRVDIGGLLRPTEELAAEDRTGFVVDASLVEAGSQFFVTLGCANCHQLDLGDGLITADLSGKAIGDMRETMGTLSSSQTGPCPDFALDQRQRQSIQSFVVATKSDGAIAELDLEESIHHTLTTFNCYACHQRGELGGVARDRDSWFVGDEPEMGDEGRIPPLLTGVGAKLNKQWMSTLLDQGAKVRPYMKTQMPRFGMENVGHLVEDFAKADPLVGDVAEFEIEETERRVKVTGRMLVGRKALSCIQCHTWGNTRSTGIQAMSLTTMTERLNKDWFQLYMLDANQFRPGTRMPNSWPRGKTYYPELLGGDTHAQIHAVWKYLEDGESAARPEGLTAPGILLADEEKPVVYRNFVEGAGTRAIAVGYPEKANLAFDGNQMAYALLWQGDFIDAARHWQGRGQGWQGPAGENILKLESRPLLASMMGSEDEWPSFADVQSDWRFRGYRFDEQRRPHFRYTYTTDDQVISIEDGMIPAVEDAYPFFRRQLRIEGKPGTTVTMLIATGSEVERLDDTRIRIDDWEIEVPAESSSQQAIQIFKNQNGKFELRTQLRFVDGELLEREVIYRW